MSFVQTVSAIRKDLYELLSYATVGSACNSSFYTSNEGSSDDTVAPVVIFALSCVEEDMTISSLVKPAITLLRVRVAAGSRVAMDGPEYLAMYQHQAFAIVVCEREATLEVPPGLPAIWCSIYGDTEISTPHWNAHLERNDVCVGDVQFQYHVSTPHGGVCVGIVGSPQIWSEAAKGASFQVRSSPVPLPAVRRRSNPLCRKLFTFVRTYFTDSGNANCGCAARELSDLVDELQSDFVGPITRCPGSSLARKRAVFARLQRVRHLIASRVHEDLDISRLAFIANYSIAHFITIYRSVFGETPYSSISRQRLQSASSLLSNSQLGVAEIAHSIGFRTQSTFSRAIRRHLGLSATQFRASSHALPAKESNNAD